MWRSRVDKTRSPTPLHYPLDQVTTGMIPCFTEWAGIYTLSPLVYSPLCACSCKPACPLNMSLRLSSPWNRSKRMHHSATRSTPAVHVMRLTAINCPFSLPPSAPAFGRFGRDSSLWQTAVRLCMCKSAEGCGRCARSSSRMGNAGSGTCQREMVEPWKK